MGSDTYRRLTLNPDGTFVVEHVDYFARSGDWAGGDDEYYKRRTDTGTYVREGNSAIVFTIASSACNADAGKVLDDLAKELVGKTVRCAIVDGNVMGYPSPGFAPEASCPMSV
jgi:hypothetical protein